MRALAFALATSLLAAGCDTPQDLCGYLDDSIQRCNLPSTRVDCSAAEEASKAIVAQRLAKADCAGLAADDDSGAVDPRLCALAGWSCPDTPTPAPSAAVPAYPLMLVSGIDGSAAFDWHPRIRTQLRKYGVDSHHVSVRPWATTAARAADLWQSLQSYHARYGTKLNLVCWAVGGLDCRYLVSPHGLFADDDDARAEVVAAIASITTVATPHRGTRVAEAALSALRSAVTEDLLAALVGADVSVPDDAALVLTLQGLTPEALFSFNQDVDDEPGIFYQSWAGVSELSGQISAAEQSLLTAHCPQLFQHPGAPDTSNLLLWATYPFSGSANGDDGRVVVSPSDGMVSVASARWGEFRGCVAADHYDVVGQIGHSTRDPLTGFDAASFYRYVASDLATRGF